MAARKSLYVCRPLLNGDELHEWAASQGFVSALPKDDLHVTVAFSREPFDWSAITSKRGQLETHGGRRSIEKFGDAIVLRFASNSLTTRWNDLRNAGASWDFPDYKAHVTITYKGAPDDLDEVEPYRGPLLFGSERFAEVDEGEADGEKKETPLASTTTSPNNRAVKFRGQGAREMASTEKPIGGLTTLPKAAKLPGPKHAARTRKRARSAAKRGLISDAAMKKHMGEAY